MVDQGTGKLNVRCSGDHMEAFITVKRPEPGDEVTLGMLEEALAAKGVCAGIDKERLNEIVTRGLYDKEIRVAVGKAPVDGKDGYFEYLFNREFNKRPRILEDGTADYRNMKMIEQVHAGQEIVKYHPPVQGEEGYTVKGIPRVGHRGRELVPLKGKGFSRSADNLTYIAELDGKIEMSADRINILATYEISGDADLNIGNINFTGDVIIHGGVPSGMCIRATGNIMIDGIVEAAQLEAGKDIVLRSGMMGGQRATVYTKGNLFAKFCEYTTIDVEGNIEADVLMECHTHCKGLITLNGKRGAIVGGMAQATQGIDAAYLGNQAEVPTEVCVGVPSDTMQRVTVLTAKVDTARENLDVVEEKLAEFEDLELAKGVSYREDPRRLKLLRIKIQSTATLAQDRMELDGLKELLERSKDATVRARHTAYPGVTICLNEARITLKVPQRNSEFVMNENRVTSCGLGDGL